jgi:hypothetical protein
MIADLLNRFDPDGDVLLRAISAHVTDEMLHCISKADYGDRADEHFEALRQLREAGTFPQNMALVPMEVLELIRWSEPDDPAWKPGMTGEAGHWIRAFSCAAILRAEHPPFLYHYNDGSTASTVIQLVLSLDALPVNLSRVAAQDFAWLILSSDPDGKNDSVREYAVALLWFALQLNPPLPDENMVVLAQWVIKRADELKWHPALKEFSGLKEMVITCQKRSGWELLGCKLSDIDLDTHSVELRTLTRLIAEQLTD